MIGKIGCSCTAMVVTMALWAYAVMGSTAACAAHRAESVVCPGNPARCSYYNGRIVSIDLSSMGLTSLAIVNDSFAQFWGLQSLILNDNQLTFLSADVFCNLTNLRVRIGFVIDLSL